MRKTAYILSLILLFMLPAGCGQAADSVGSATEDRYQEREIREYEGARLDPSIGPRDNSIKGVQYIDLADYSLKVDGLVENPRSWSYDDVLALESSERLVTLHCVEGWDATVLWEGVRLMDLIGLAKPFSDASVVIFHSVDGYTTSLPLSTVEERDLLLAYKSNGLELPPELGFPFIVVAEDKLGYKWARWVEFIELSADTDYEGYWESRGYSNDAESGKE